MDAKKTYCNPLPIPDLPRGKDGWYNAERGMFSHENKPSSVTWPDYRSISDPTVFYYDNKWYLYPSYGMAWVSEDFCTWEHHRTEPYCPKYSPSVIRWNGKFLLATWCSPLYEADSPLGPFRELGPLVLPDGREVFPNDPGIFADEDGRLYLYAFEAPPQPGSRYFCSTIMGYELDRNDPTRVLRGPIPVVRMDPAARPWERSGNANQNTHFAWVEGPHLVRHGGRYYLICAAPNTEFESYCMEVFWSDDPLSGFVCQKKNPLTIHKTGLVRGCGHGCVEHGPDGTLWAFYTVATPYAHMYERRIGMDRVEVDENGELYCPYGVTDVPCAAPGTRDAGRPLGLLPLTGWRRPTVSSAAPGRDALYACDGSSLTWWQPAADDPAPSLTINMTDPYLCSAVRIFFRDVGLDYAAGARPGPIRYILEGAADGAPDVWFPLVDRTASDTDFNIDYRAFNEVSCRYLRLRITGAPAGITPGVIDFTVFGRADDSAV